MREIGLTEIAVNVVAGDTYFIRFPRLLAEDATVRIRFGDTLDAPALPVPALVGYPESQDVTVSWIAGTTGRQRLLLTREAEEPYAGDVRLLVWAADGGMMASSLVPAR